MSVRRAVMHRGSEGIGMTVSQGNLSAEHG